MPSDVIDPFSDPRVAHCTALVNGLEYKYLYAVPESGEYKATIFLIHGWPDCSLGWRYQIPLLLKMSLRVVCPDLMGFGGTSAPRVPPDSLALYSQKRASADIRELARQLGASKIILGGHGNYTSFLYRGRQADNENILGVRNRYLVLYSDSRYLTSRPKSKAVQGLYILSSPERHICIREFIRRHSLRLEILRGADNCATSGAVVYRCALWNPDLVSHVFSVCTPYTAPTRSFASLEMVVERAPQFGYQIHLAGPEVEAAIKTDDEIRAFLHGMYGARGPNRETLFSPENGLLLQNLSVIGRTPLLTDREMDYYVREYQRNGLHGTLNWYRTRKINWEEELSLKTSKIEIPVLFIQANKDSVLLPSMSAGMEKLIPNLTRGEVEAGHWALWQAPDAVNDLIKHWIHWSVFRPSAAKI